MASDLLRTFQKIENGRKSIINTLNSSGSVLSKNASLNNINNEILSRTLEDASVRDPYLTTYYDEPLKNDPTLPKAPKMFLDYVEMFRELDPIEYNGTIYYPGVMTIIDTALDSTVFNVDTYPNGSAKTNGIRIGYYGNKIVKTSDGGEYIFTQSTQDFTHTWDRSKDLYDEESDLNYRYLITYTSNTGLEALKNNTVIVYGYIQSMRRFGGSGNSVASYSNVKWGYFIGKCTKDTYNISSMSIPKFSPILEWLCVEKVPNDIVVSGYSTSDNYPHIFAETVIFGIEHDSILKLCRLNYTVRYLDVHAIALNMIGYNASTSKKPQLKYLNIRSKETQENLYMGAFPNIYPPLLKDPYLSTLITELNNSNTFYFGTNVKNFSLPNLQKISNTNTFASAVFDTLDLSNLEAVTFSSTQVKNLDVSGIKHYTASLGLSGNINYFNLSGAEIISGGAAPSTAREVDISSATTCTDNFFSNCKNLRWLRLKDNFDFNLNLKLADSLEKDCIMEIFNKAKTFNEGDENYKTKTITLSSLIKSMFTQKELNIILNKGWNLTWITP